VPNKVGLSHGRTATAEIHQVSTVSKLACHTEFWLVVRSHIFTLTFDMTNVDVALAAGLFARSLHVVVERGVVAVVCQFCAGGLRAVLESDACDDGIIASRTFRPAFSVWIAEQARDGAFLQNLGRIHPVRALPTICQVLATCEAEFSFVCPNVVTGFIGVLAANPLGPFLQRFLIRRTISVFRGLLYQHVGRPIVDKESLELDLSV
jgi:hypothetical protein